MVASSRPLPAMSVVILAYTSLAWARLPLPDLESSILRERACTALEDHTLTRQLKRAELTDASTPAMSRQPRPDLLEELSASSTSVSGNNFHVFLSFRGPDTRNGFVDHLYHRLKDVGLPFHPNFVFRDDENLPFGEDVAANLISAITGSRVSIPVISPTYASSRWCLRELIHIMKCKESRGQLVLPVLYKVSPEDVRYLRGSFGDAFRRREHRFDEEVNRQGREALKKAGDSRVFESEKFADGHEAELVNKLVEIVMGKQQEDFQPRLPVNVVGIDDRVAEVMKLMDTARPDTQVVGIYGIGGVGKTTLATAIYNKLFDKFECRSFLKDVRETIDGKGIGHVQSQLISDILKLHDYRVPDSDIGINTIQSRCTQKKVLILLDDVDRQDHLDKLIGGCSFVSGSRIIITCRDKTLLKSKYEYELKEMNAKDSLHLFSRFAFDGKEPPAELAALSSDIVATTGGLPLALMVIGSLLRGVKDRIVWREMLEKLRNAPDETVQEKLRISYDTLKYKEKQMFLDIACFFIGTEKRIATYLWEDLKFFPRIGLQILINRSLIKVDDNNELRMHDQLRDLGRAIARPEDMEPWRCSRLWDEEAIKVLRRKEENEKIEALHLDERGSREFMQRESFKRMPNLKFLDVSGVDFDTDFNDSLSVLRWLKWEGCPESFEATNVHLEKLVVLDLSDGFISENWGGWSSIKMGRLKVLNLSRCLHLQSTPNLSAFKNLEMLILEGCTYLEEIDPSIGDVKSLVSLNLRACVSLKKLPSQLGELTKLKELDIGYTAIEEIPPCIGSLKKLEMLNAYACTSGYSFCHVPYSIGKLESLTELNLSNTEISELPESIADLENLRILNISFCKKLSSLPSTISKLGKLEELNASVCQSPGGEVPIDGLSSLKILRLSSTCISGLPDAVGKLSCLEELNLAGCRMVKSLPQSISKLSSLQHLDSSNCDLQSLPELPASLTVLRVTCQQHTLPQISYLIHLKEISFHFCNLLELMPKLPSGTLKLRFYWCDKLKELPGLSSLEFLSQLLIEGCRELTEIKGLEGLKSLDYLSVSRCKKFSNLDGLEHLESLRNLEMVDLDASLMDDDLVQVQGVDRLKNLEVLEISSCGSLVRPDLSQLTHLKRLIARDCDNLVEIKGLETLKKLERLDIWGCKSIETLPDLSYFDNLNYLNIRFCGKLRDVQGLEKVASVDR
ncbi:disease resistance protein L6-like [Rhodamnia argentea]|uniref:Disease resistance protein L6-like n=1 Tax=Rhodamnia argentea TaxID=178133 RepID=A0ABM3HBS4_9MYRT|nr:disease resistance protein L6-like [Rhodamnia argentea]